MSHLGRPRNIPCPLVVVSFGSGMAIVAMTSHGQDARATADDPPRPLRTPGKMGLGARPAVNCSLREACAIFGLGEWAGNLYPGGNKWILPAFHIGSSGFC